MRIRGSTTKPLPTKTYYEPTSWVAEALKSKVLSLQGITGVAKKKALQSKRKATEKTTGWLWIKGADLWAVAAGMQVGPDETDIEKPETPEDTRSRR